MSAQLTASGGEVCDMQSPSCHTEEESEVALMQIKAQGSKLLLQQAVEQLSGLSGRAGLGSGCGPRSQCR